MKLVVLIEYINTHELAWLRIKNVKAIASVVYLVGVTKYHENFSNI